MFLVVYRIVITDPATTYDNIGVDQQMAITGIDTVVTLIEPLEINFREKMTFD